MNPQQSDRSLVSDSDQDIFASPSSPIADSDLPQREMEPLDRDNPPAAAGTGENKISKEGFGKKETFTSQFGKP